MEADGWIVGKWTLAVRHICHASATCQALSSNLITFWGKLRYTFLSSVLVILGARISNNCLRDFIPFNTYRWWVVERELNIEIRVGTISLDLEQNSPTTGLQVWKLWPPCYFTAESPEVYPIETNYWQCC